MRWHFGAKVMERHVIRPGGSLRILPPLQPRGTVGAINGAVAEGLVMAGGWLARRLVAMVALVCGCVFAGAAYAQGQDDLTQLFAEVERLHGQGKSAEAVSVAERAVALARERHG